MSEPQSVYIPCASGNSVQTDCLITLRGDLIMLLGHPAMQFTADDFAHLCLIGLDFARTAGWRDPEMDDGK